MNNAQYINQHSGKTDYGTPEYILNPARFVSFGKFSLDPASNENANRLVQAADIFIAPHWVEEGILPVNEPAPVIELPIYSPVDQGGLEADWFDYVWLNPPFSKPEKACSPKCSKKTCIRRGYHVGSDIPGIGSWVEKAVAEYQKGNVESIVMITFASTSEKWFQPLHDFPQCYIRGRVNYLDEHGNEVKGVTKGSVVTYMGTHVNRFAKAFEHLGSVKTSIR